ncbi:MAG TPA: hypothetical protein VJ044_01765, partial [Candidatus Hodarchaeales archaeon]|nr:hypothetical protein [Candidatus Hodarchaeales archaeon]
PLELNSLNESVANDLVNQQNVFLASGLADGILSQKLWEELRELIGPVIWRFKTGADVNVDLTPLQLYGFLSLQDFPGYHKIFMVLGLLEFFPEFVVPLIALAQSTHREGLRSFIISSQTAERDLVRFLSESQSGFKKGKELISVVALWIAKNHKLLKMIVGEDPFVARRNMNSALYFGTYEKYCSITKSKLYGGIGLIVSAEVKPYFTNPCMGEL